MQHNHNHNPNTNARGVARLQEEGRVAAARVERRRRKGERRPTPEAQLLVAHQARTSRGVATKYDAVEVQPVNPTVDGSRSFVRGLTRQDALEGSRTGFPFYRRPFAGCKTLNLTLTSTAITWNGLIFAPMTSITQGAADNQRTGDTIRMLGFDYRVRVSLGSAAAPTANAEYLFQVCWTPLQSLPISTIFQDVGTAYSGMSSDDWDYEPLVPRKVRKSSFVDSTHPMRVHGGRVTCDDITTFDNGTAVVSTGYWAIAFLSGVNPASGTAQPLTYGTFQFYYQDV